MERARCPHCQAPRVDGPECPSCGVIYEKAAARAAGAPRLEVEPVASEPLRPAEGVLAPETPAWDMDAEEEQLELRLRLVAIPAALAFAFLITANGFLRGVSRIFCSMWLHELGHAIAAWLSGFSAFPGPWRTSVSDTRSWLVSVLLAAAWLRLGQMAYRDGKYGRVAALGALLALQGVCTLVVRENAARAFITFMGDGGALVLGSVLMLTVYARPGSWLHRGALRWGFLLIGAVGFADIFRTWWSARTDWTAIPFGANEGVGLSDPTKLVDTHGWSERGLVQAYVGLAVACLIVLAVAYVAGAIRQRKRLG